MPCTWSALSVLSYSWISFLSFPWVRDSLPCVHVCVQGSKCQKLVLHHGQKHLYVQHWTKCPQQEGWPCVIRATCLWCQHRETGLCPNSVATCQCAITSEYEAELVSEWFRSQVLESQLTWDGCWTYQRVCRLAVGGARRSEPERSVCMCVFLCEAPETKKIQGSVTH